MKRLLWPLALLAAAAPARGQPNVPSPENTFTYEQKLGAQLPGDAAFVDEAGRDVTLGDYFRSRPVILALVQFRCPMLCGEVLNGLVECTRGMKGDAGDAYDVVVVSFDPREKPELAAAKKRSYVEEYGRSGGERGWHFLTGKQESIHRLTEAVGFRYAYSPFDDRYAHGSGVVVLTPSGTVSRYFYGILYDPREMTDGLALAARGETGKTVPQYLRVLMLCYQETGGSVMNILRSAAVLTVLILGFFLVRSWLRAGKAPGPRSVRGGDA
jgi:protein SCO1/2